jgi:hypothetical protein
MAATKKTTTKKTTTTRRRQPGGRDTAPNGAAPESNGATSSRTRTAQTAGASKSRSKPAARTAAKSRSSASRNGSSGARSAPRASTQNGSGGKLKHLGGDVLHAVERGAKPALAIGATAAGVAGGIALRRRQRTVLGVPVPRGTDGLDIVAISKALGRASLQLGQTAKRMSKDIDHAADRAEKIGKILS